MAWNFAGLCRNSLISCSSSMASGRDQVEERVALRDVDVVSVRQVALVELRLQLILELQALAGDPGSLEVLAALGGDLDRLVLVDDQRALDLALIDELDDLRGVNLLV